MSEYDESYGDDSYLRDGFYDDYQDHSSGYISPIHGYYDHYGSSDSSDDDDISEESDSGNDGEVEHFFLTVHKGSDFDEDITKALAVFSSDGTARVETVITPDWERNALINLKNDIQDLTNKADTGILGDLALRADTRPPELRRNPYGIIRGIDSELIVQHDQSLIPFWNGLSNATRKRDGFAVRDVDISKVQLTKEVIGMIFDRLTIRGALKLCHVSICGEGIKRLSSMIEKNPHKFEINIYGSPIVDADAALCLSNAMKAKSLRTVSLIDCDIGQSAEILSAILDADIQDLDLENNGIGSAGAVKISEYLERDTSMKTLDLSSNELRDDNAIILANALKKNKHLCGLNLSKNNFTAVGVKALTKAIFDPTSLNTISESNHSCQLGILWYGDNISEWIRRLKDFNREGKIMMALHEKERMLPYLNDVPVKCMPDVLGMIQEVEKDSQKSRDMVYNIMRWWSMPSMYTYLRPTNAGIKRKIDDAD